MSDGQHEVQRSIDADNARWTQCMDCRDRDDCHLRNLGHTGCEWHQGPPLAYQATGGADWQTANGWGYEPLNEAAMAHRLRRLASDLQQAANALAAIGRCGRVRCGP